MARNNNGIFRFVVGISTVVILIATAIVIVLVVNNSPKGEEVMVDMAEQERSNLDEDLSVKRAIIESEAKELVKGGAANVDEIDRLYDSLIVRAISIERDDIAAGLISSEKGLLVANDLKAEALNILKDKDYSGIGIKRRLLLYDEIIDLATELGDDDTRNAFRQKQENEIVEYRSRDKTVGDDTGDINNNNVSGNQAKEEGE